MLNAEQVKKLIREKCPPQTQNENIYASILVACVERLDGIQTALEKTQAQMIEVRKATMILAKLITKGSEGEESAPAPAAVEEQGSPIVDKTPFPAGLSPSVGGAAAATPKATPAAEAAPEVEIPQPNVGSFPSKNAAPIPSQPKKAAKNGAKESEA